MLVCRDCAESYKNDEFVVVQWSSIISNNSFKNFVALDEGVERQSNDISNKQIELLERLWKDDPSATLETLQTASMTSKKHEKVKIVYSNEHEYARIMKPLIISEYTRVIDFLIYNLIRLVGVS